MQPEVFYTDTNQILHLIEAGVRQEVTYCLHCGSSVGSYSTNFHNNFVRFFKGDISFCVYLLRGVTQQCIWMMQYHDNKLKYFCLCHVCTCYNFTVHTPSYCNLLFLIRCIKLSQIKLSPLVYEFLNGITTTQA